MIKEKKRKKIIIYFALVVLIIGSFFLGVLVGQRRNYLSPVIVGKNSPPSDFSSKIDFKIFWDAWRLIKKDFYQQPVSDKDLFYGAISGLVESLDDPYSLFLEPKTAKEFVEDLSGKFEGIGAEIGIRKKQLTIIAPLAKSPAEKAGIRAGDKIYAIDGKETSGMSLEEAVRLIRGKKGTKVVLTIMREGFEEPKDFTIIRDVIKIPTVQWEMKDKNIAYIKLSHFDESTLKDFKSAAKEILLQKPKGIILDLRNNPGGFLGTAIDIANYWIKKGAIVREKSPKTMTRVHYARSYAPFADFPTVVLVNQGSASASEIVAGALQDYQIATILGEKTFGKGTVQELQFLDDGSAIKLTVAQWLTANGRQINEKGITPDIQVEMTEEDYDNNRDPQLSKALELLEKK